MDVFVLLFFHCCFWYMQYLHCANAVCVWHSGLNVLVKPHTRLGGLPFARTLLEAGQFALVQHIQHLDAPAAARAVWVVGTAWHEHQVSIHDKIVQGAYLKAVADLSVLTVTVR